MSTAEQSPQALTLPADLTRQMWAAAGTAVFNLQSRGIGHHDKIVEGVWEALKPFGTPATSGGGDACGSSPQEAGEPVATTEYEDAMRERAYLAGMKAGWNFGAGDDKDGFMKAVEARDGYLKPILARRQNPTSPPTDPRIKALEEALTALVRAGEKTSRVHAPPALFAALCEANELLRSVAAKAEEKA